MTVRLDHVGVVVPDLAAASAFFTDALGFRPVREATLGDPADRLPETFGAPDGATLRVAFFETTELLEWTAPGAATDVRAPQDAGTAHLALAVADVVATAARLGTLPGVTVFEAHRRGFVYVRTPWGLLLQLVPA
jgi:catechol 2,3-dioxygenase-like lactoylglutathione lyase family enzyme